MCCKRENVSKGGIYICIERGERIEWAGRATMHNSASWEELRGKVRRTEAGRARDTREGWRQVGGGIHLNKVNRWDLACRYKQSLRIGMPVAQQISRSHPACLLFGETVKYVYAYIGQQL